ncbi:E3 ubiquitin-protein ligase Praja-2 isoform 2-T2 [Pelodytes ibericus]
MGQEACKVAWPKPAGGYQTITGRRYGRRHAYVSFRPSLESPNRTSSQQSRDCEGLELGDVQKENNLISEENCASSIYSIGSSLNVAFQEDDGEHVNSISVVSGSEGVGVSRISASDHTNGRHTLGNNNNCMSTTTTHTMHAPVEHSHHSLHSGISFVNIDSFEPDSSEGEENVCNSGGISLTKETGKPRKSLDTMHSAVEKERFIEKMSGSSTLNHSYAKDSLSLVCPVTLGKHYSMDLSPAQAQWNASMDEATGVAWQEVSESQQKKNGIDIAAKGTVTICHELNTNHAKHDQGNEPVVRPKIRKPASSSSCTKTNLLTVENEGKENTTTRRGNRDLQESAERTCKDERSHCDLIFDPVNFEGGRNQIRTCSKDRELATLPDKPTVDDAFWDDFEVYGMKLSDSNKDEDSDGEWSTCLPSYFSGDKDHSSSDESWETLPGKEEHEVQSNSSSLEEDNSDFCFQVEEQTLEDGEIPWLQYHEDIESSTDEENEMGSHFVHPGFFMLDGNNNLEDDSSMSEDLEVEWRLLDDFGDGLGVAQAMSYVDPQFLTYMALEERLAQAMETALAHLESLAVDVEQAHPPATKESIECLPQIVITDDHTVVGQEQCCAICCSEYIKDEILTELPCHHLFHKPCVTLWLQKSGTCPVCRHILAPLLPEAAATSFLSDHESPPSIHSAAGTR